MGFLDSIKRSLTMSEEEYLDDVDVQEDEEEEYTPVRRRFTSAKPARQYDAPVDNVVDIKASAPAASGSSKAHVVFKKVDAFEEVGPVADVLNEKRIGILNLETCPNDDSRRIIDFLSGVAYANDATIQRVAGRAYIITPNNVPLSGELLDEVVNSAANGLF
jgi:cell division inhibitor SepF